MLKERKNGYINNLENSKRQDNKEDIISERKRIRKKLKRLFSPDEKVKMKNLNRKLNKTELKINKNLEDIFNINKANDTENNHNTKEKIKNNINEIIEENKNIIKQIDINDYSSKTNIKINSKIGNFNKGNITNSSQYKNRNRLNSITEKSKDKLFISDIKERNEKHKENRNYSSKKKYIQYKEKFFLR